MRARSAWLSHPKFKATWVALAAGSLAGLAVLGACSDAPVSKIAGPGPSIDAPRFVGSLGANAHLIKVCVDQASTPGTYNFGMTVVPPPPADIGRTLELPSIKDAPSPYQTFLGPYIPGDAVATSASIVLPVGATVPVCSTVFARDDTRLHVNNRILTLPIIGVVNPYATLDVTLGSLPAGSTFSALCSNDDTNLPQTTGCVTAPITANPIRSSANVFHGSTITYTITVPTQNTPCPAGSFTFALNDDGDLVIIYDQFPAPNDNSYGANAVGWGNRGKNTGHSFKDLVNSDHAGIQIKSTSGQVKLSFLVDYLSKTSVTGATPSGYASLGVTGGDGGMITGTASGITATTSLDKNLNTLSFCSDGNCTGAGTDLLVDSPPTTSSTSYTLASGLYTGWDFRNTYYVTISAWKLSQLGLGTNWTPTAATVLPNLAGLHNSPAKVCPVI